MLVLVMLNISMRYPWITFFIVIIHNLSWRCDKLAKVVSRVASRCFAASSHLAFALSIGLLGRILAASPVLPLNIDLPRRPWDRALDTSRPSRASESLPLAGDSDTHWPLHTSKRLLLILQHSGLYPRPAASEAAQEGRGGTLPCRHAGR